MRRLLLAVAILALDAAAGLAVAAQRLDGVNVVAAAGHPLGSEQAGKALAAAAAAGARAVAFVPFLWQSRPDSTDIVRGSDMPDDELRAGIRQARALGLAVVVKPHVWVPQAWAGAVEPTTDDGWRAWFDAYTRALAQIAVVASQEQADVLVIGTELARTSTRAEWRGLIARVRTVFSGRLTYVAHNATEAEAIAFWDALDLIGASLYPPLGADGDRAARLAAMRSEAERLDALATRYGKPVLIGEIGVRSAQGAAARPWESAEERDAVPDAALQAAVLADWLAVLSRASVHGVMIWRWLTDPAAGGAADTDFTVQRKPAEAMLRCAWGAMCDGGELEAIPGSEQ